MAVGKIRQLLGGFIACLVVVSPFSAPEAGEINASRYQLGSGDKLRINFRGEHYSDLSGDYEIVGDGIAALPLVGNIYLGGKTVSEAAKTIMSAYKPSYIKDPEINVQVLNYRPFYIWGQVDEPGKYPHINGMTVLEAVVIAGGFIGLARIDQSKQEYFKIIRGDDPSRTERDARQKTVVMPGDVIEVPLFLCPVCPKPEFSEEFRENFGNGQFRQENFGTGQFRREDFDESQLLN
jgi:polysaccharide export outer membrane protein